MINSAISGGHIKKSSVQSYLSSPKQQTQQKLLSKHKDYSDTSTNDDYSLNEQTINWHSLASNPFKWQIQQHYKKLVTFFADLSDSELISIIEGLIEEIGLLSSEDPEFFDEVQVFIIDKIRSTLKKHLEDNVLSYETYLKTLCQTAYASDHGSEASDDLDHSGLNPYEIEFMKGYERDWTEELPSDENNALGSFGTYQGLSLSPVFFKDKSSLDDNEYEAWRQTKLFELGNIDDVQNLLSNCMDHEQGYSWLINEFVEGSYVFSSELIEKINFSKLGISTERASMIVNSLWFSLDWEQHSVLDSNYVAQTFISTLKTFSAKVSIEERQWVIERFTNPLLFWHNKNLPIELQTLETRYNQAYQENDLLQMQSLWSIYARYRKAFHDKNIYDETEKSDSAACYAAALTTVKKFNNGKYLTNRLQKAMDRADNYYTMKVYPHTDTDTLIYSAKKSAKLVTLNLIQKFAELETIGATIEEVRSGYTKNANILVPELCFVVTDRPHSKGGEHSRCMVSIPLDLDYQTRLLSKNDHDGVFTSTAAGKKHYMEQVTKDFHHGMKISGMSESKAHSKLEKSSPREINHSERVLFEVLKSQKNIHYIVEMLRVEMAENVHAYELTGHYKVYSVALLLYSTNSICTFCTPSIISMQNSYEAGFLKLLTEELNTPQEGKINFKTRGLDTTTKVQDYSKFKIQVIANAKINFDPQANDLACQHMHKTAPKESSNPEARLILENDVIDLNAAVPTETQPFFLEFVGVEFKKIYTGPLPQTFNGICFMSGASGLNAKVPKGLLTREYEYISMAEEAEDLVGEGSIAHIRESNTNNFFNRYHSSGLENILALRLKEAGIHDVSILPSIKFSEEQLDQLCITISKQFTSGIKNIVCPINLDNRHWVGLLCKMSVVPHILYLDSEKQGISHTLLSSLRKHFGNAVTIENGEVELQKFNNCGPEFIENTVQFLGGQRVLQDAAVPLHSQLYEQEIVKEQFTDFAIPKAHSYSSFPQLPELEDYQAISWYSEFNLMEYLVQFNQKIETYLIELLSPDRHEAMAQIAKKYGINDAENLKIAYKAISLKSHPDKTVNLPQSQKEERELDFLKAKEIYEGGKDFNIAEQIYRPIIDTLQKCNLAIKTSDTIIQLTRTIYDPNQENIVKVATGIITTGALYIGEISPMQVITTIEIGFKIYGEDYTGAMQTGIATIAIAASYNSICSVLPILCIPLALGATLYNGYKTLDNSNALYHELYAEEPNSSNSAVYYNDTIDI